MKHNRLHINVENYEIVLENKRTGKTKKKEFNALEEHIYNRAPNLEEFIICEEDKEEETKKKLLQCFEGELEDYFEKRFRRFKIKEIIFSDCFESATPCAAFTLEWCIKEMTPKQFFSEFGNFPIDILNKV